MKKLKLLLLFIMAITIKEHVNSQDSTILARINSEVWDKFEKAFVTNDVNLFNSLHTKDALRIPADKKVIISAEDYFESQVKSFRWVKENDYKTKMEMRFIERICNEINASEKGIFKFTVIDDEGDERIFYGKFHVLLRNENNTWKIFMNYDSIEEETINEETFNKAFSRTNYVPFQRQPE